VRRDLFQANVRERYGERPDTLPDESVDGGTWGCGPVSAPTFVGNITEITINHRASWQGKLGAANIGHGSTAIDRTIDGEIVLLSRSAFPCLATAPCSVARVHRKCASLGGVTSDGRCGDSNGEDGFADKSTDL
jgi:hypothetical protein